MPVSLRPVHKDDEAFLYELYCSTRLSDIGMAGLEPAQQAALLEIQFIGQRQQYEADFPEADHDIILLEGRPIGRVMVNRTAEANLGVDIALLPAHRNSGIGGMLINDLLDEARNAGKPFRIHVERFNPAVRLYERLGFETIGETPTHLLMEWNAAV
jgi:GNAT superfamily N-acetyltransferase